MFRLIQKILSPKHSRLLTLMGLPGIGKSSLTANTLDYISERKLLKGGSIFINMSNIKCPEEFVRRFNQTLITENPALFGNANSSKQQSLSTFTLILEKIQMVMDNFQSTEDSSPAILIVLDNAEDLI